MSDRALRLAIAALSALGAAIAAYLTYTHLAHATVACATGGCETVQQSRYSEVAGVPIAAFGLGMFLLLLASSLTARDVVVVAAAGLAVAGAAYAAYLVYLQVAVLHAICQWCVASDATTAALAVLTLARALRESPARPAPRASTGGARPRLRASRSARPS